MSIIVLHRDNAYPVLGLEVRLRSDGPSEASVVIAATDATVARNIHVDDRIDIEVTIDGLSSVVFSGLVDSAETRGVTIPQITLRCTSIPWRKLSRSYPASKTVFRGCEWVTGRNAIECHDTVIGVVRKLSESSGVQIQEHIQDCRLSTDLTWDQQSARQVLESVLSSAGYFATSRHKVDFVEQDGTLHLVRRSSVSSTVEVTLSQLISRTVTTKWTQWAETVGTRGLCVVGGDLPQVVDESRMRRCRHETPGDEEEQPSSVVYDRECTGSRVQSVMDAVVTPDGRSVKQWHYVYDSLCRITSEHGSETVENAKSATSQQSSTTVSYSYDPLLKDKMVERVENTLIEITQADCVKTGSRLRVEHWRYVTSQGEVYPEWHGVAEYGMTPDEMECGSNPTVLRRLENTYYVISGKQMVKRTTSHAWSSDGQLQSSRESVEVSAGEWVGRGQLIFQATESARRWFDEAMRHVLFYSNLPSWATPRAPTFPVSRPDGSDARLHNETPPQDCSPVPSSGLPPGKTLVRKPIQAGACGDNGAARAHYPGTGDQSCVNRILSEISDEANLRVHTMSAELVPVLEIRPGVRLAIRGDTLWNLDWYVTEVDYLWDAKKGLTQRVTALAWS